MKRPGGWRSSLSSLHVPEESSTKWSQRSCCTDFNQASAGLFFSLNPSAESMKGLGGLCVWLLPPLPKSEGLGSAHPLQQCRATAAPCSVSTIPAAFHLLKAWLKLMPPPSLSISLVWKTGEGLREKQVCKQLPQLPSALGLQEDIKTIHSELSGKSFSLSMGGIHILVLPSLTWDTSAGVCCCCQMCPVLCSPTPLGFAQPSKHSLGVALVGLGELAAAQECKVLHRPPSTILPYRLLSRQKAFP